MPKFKAAYNCTLIMNQPKLKLHQHSAENGQQYIINIDSTQVRVSPAISANILML